MIPTFLDIEASGLHFDSYPIEIALLQDGRMRSWLIRPEAKWTHWCEQAQAMHGLSRAMLTAQGLPAKTVAAQLNEFLADGNGLVYSDACAWDEDWINTLFHAAGEVRQFHLLQIEDLLEEEQSARFHQALRELQASGDHRRHRAGQDVAMLYAAYVRATGISKRSACAGKSNN